MKKQLLYGIALFTILCSCSSKKETVAGIIKQLYSQDNLESQNFLIDNSKDTVVKGNSGTVISIPKNAFVDSLGNVAKGKIQIELKEALTLADIVLSNLTTQSDGKPLQTGGMIYLNATSEGQSLQLGNNKEIGVAVQTKKVQEGMEIYEGVRDSTGINWKNPVPLKKRQQKASKTTGDDLNSETNTRHVNYTQVVRNKYGEEVTPSKKVSKAIDEFIESKAIRSNLDTIIKVEGFAIEITINKFKDFDKPQYAAPELGINSFRQDENTSYLFSIKKLGWANIDRLYNDKRSQEVELITAIDNYSEFESIYTTMVTEQMFLPGYQMENKTFSFTHSDDEKPVLPVGAKATIMCTAYKNDKAYFDIQKIVISKNQTVSLHLNETTKGELKKILEKNL